VQLGTGKPAAGLAMQARDPGRRTPPTGSRTEAGQPCERQGVPGAQARGIELPGSDPSLDEPFLQPLELAARGLIEGARDLEADVIPPPGTGRCPSPGLSRFRFGHADPPHHRDDDGRGRDRSSSRATKLPGARRLR